MALGRRQLAQPPHAGNRIGAIEFHIKGCGACPDEGMRIMLRKMTIGLAALAIISAATAMSVSAATAASPSAEQKVRATILKEVCETLTVNTQNWGQQTVQVCGPPGGPHGQATSKQQQNQKK
jgi:hypothetical protein